MYMNSNKSMLMCVHVSPMRNIAGQVTMINWNRILQMRMRTAKVRAASLECICVHAHMHTLKQTSTKYTNSEWSPLFKARTRARKFTHTHKHTMSCIYDQIINYSTYAVFAHIRNVHVTHIRAKKHAENWHTRVLCVCVRLGVWTLFVVCVCVDIYKHMHR